MRNIPDMFWENIAGGQLQMIVLIVICSLLLVQLLYFFVVFGSFAFKKVQTFSHNICHPVSVVICAKNEHYHLERNLPLILEQDYPDYEVVVVNDASEDETALFLESISRKYTHLKVIHLEQDLNFFRGKKFPLSIGIKSAQNNILILTDSDCRPADKNWIRSMQSAYTKDRIKIVLGYGGYETKKGLLNKLIRFDTLSIAMQYFSFATIGMPYMGVGRNLSYKKDFFNEKKGFISHYHLQSGDDDLFVNQNAVKKNTEIVFAEEAHTISEPNTLFYSWFIQKKRHLSSGSYYKLSHKILLTLFPLTTLMFYTAIALQAALYPNLYTILVLIALFLIRVFSQFLIIKKCMIRLKEKNLFLFSPLFEVFVIFFNFYVSISNLIKPLKAWK